MRPATIVTVIAVVCGFCLSAPAQQADMTFFITSAGPGKGADLGGLAGADAHCQALAQAAGAATRRGAPISAPTAAAARMRSTRVTASARARGRMRRAS